MYLFFKLNGEFPILHRLYRGDNIIVCECGELVEEDTFVDYIKTSANPSTRTIGHRQCGIIFNFIDGKFAKRYSSRKELKILAAKFAGKNELLTQNIGEFLLEVDRLKSRGQLSDAEILIGAYKKMLETKKHT